MQDAGAEIAQIRKLLRKIKYNIDIKLIRGNPKVTVPFKDNPIEHLILQYNMSCQ